MKWQIYYADDIYLKDTVVFTAILDAEGQPYEVIQDIKHTFLLTQGTNGVAIKHDGKYVGYHYSELVDYLEGQGLMRC